jgi:quinol monooxygenase YgiN
VPAYTGRMIIVTGSIQARRDTLDELRLLSLEHVARSRAEPGCLEHGVALDANDGLRLVFFERWADRAALLAHFKVPASREFVAEAGRLAAHPPEIATYDASETALR